LQLENEPDGRSPAMAVDTSCKVIGSPRTGAREAVVAGCKAVDSAANGRQSSLEPQRESFDRQTDKQQLTAIIQSISMGLAALRRYSGRYSGKITQITF
jgi:hypothetical protein